MTLSGSSYMGTCDNVITKMLVVIAAAIVLLVLEGSYNYYNSTVLT